jgi:hypothetical protein
MKVGLRAITLRTEEKNDRVFPKAKEWQRYKARRVYFEGKTVKYPYLIIVVSHPVLYITTNGTSIVVQF